MSFDSTACAIISCDVFKDELDHYGADHQWRSIVYLEMGLHDQPDVLRAEVQSAITQLEGDSAIESILLLYGVCGNGLIGVCSNRCQLVLPRAHDCISILMGGPDVHEEFLREQPGAYFYSPGWVRGRRVPGPDRNARLLDHYSRKFPDDPELVEDLIEADHETFAHHNCAAYVDVTKNTAAEAYCRQCSKALGWSYRKLEGDPLIIRDLLSGQWDSERFLVVGPSTPVTDVLTSAPKLIQG